MPEYLAPGVYIEETSFRRQPIDGAPTSIAAFVGWFARGPVNQPVELRSAGDLDAQLGGLDARSEASYAIRQFFANGGKHAYAVRVTGETDLDLPGAAELIGDEATGTGLFALDRVPAVNLICTPGVAGEAGSGRPGEAARVLEAALAHCVRRRALLLVDTPVGVRTPGGIARWLDPALRSPNAALYFPRLLIADPLARGRTRSVGASGTMAGVIARIDEQRGVWKAPAGTDASLVDVTGFDLDRPLSVAAIDELNPQAINVLRDVPGTGPVAWGARTLDGAAGRGSEWVYIPVRRLALFVGESIQRGTQWAVFEPNGEPLWANLRADVEAFLHGLFRRGAFTGNTPPEAYFVRCDATTMTEADRRRGVVTMTVGIAPTRPREFVVLHIQLRTADANAGASSA